jgi:CheY-like chemotaxis protein
MTVMGDPSSSDRVLATQDASLARRISVGSGGSSVPNLPHRYALFPALGPERADAIREARRAVVLLVDDEPHVIEGLRLALRTRPFDIVAAASGLDALRVLEGMRVDVVVSDDCMPGISGSDLLALVRQSAPATIRIMLTGNATLDATSRAINEGGAFGFLTKPCDSRVLCAMIEQALFHRDNARAPATPTG